MDAESSPPVVYIFHGDDVTAIERHTADLLERMGDPVTAQLNTSRLDGRQAGLEELRGACLALPFLAARRLVILRNPLARLEKKDKTAQERFTALLDEIPPSTALVLPVEDYRERRDWKVLPVERHWLREWIRKAGRRALLRECLLPAPSSMPGWITRQAGELGGRFRPAAAEALAALVGSDTQIALQEVRKLLEYANYQRPVEAEDVQRLTSFSGQANLFDMVDALGAGDAGKAQRLLVQLLEDNEEMVFGMVVRQFRLLLQVREALDEGLPQDQVTKELKLHPYVTGKLVSQAGRFSLARLEQIYHQLLEIDEAVKTSQMSLPTALNLLVVEAAL